MGLFQEYLNSKGKVAKPVTDISGDQVDPKNPPNKPPKGDKPYANSDGKSKKGSSKGLGDEGDAALKYTPAHDSKNKGHAPAKIPTVEQAEICSLVVDAAKKDVSIVEQMVAQLRRNGLLGPVVAEMLQYKETYKHMAEVMGHNSYGPAVCGRLVRAMNEEVAPPFSDALDGVEKATEEDEEFENQDIEDETGINDEGVMDEIGLSDDEEEMPIGDPNLAAPPAQPLMQMPAAMKHFQRAMMARQ